MIPRCAQQSTMARSERWELGRYVWGGMSDDGGRWKDVESEMGESGTVRFGQVDFPRLKRSRMDAERRMGLRLVGDAERIDDSDPPGEPGVGGVV